MRDDDPDKSAVVRVGRNIAAERARRDLTQESLAELSGVSLASLARMERGEIHGRLMMYLRLAQALGVPVEALLQGVEAGRRRSEGR